MTDDLDELSPHDEFLQGRRLMLTRFCTCTDCARQRPATLLVTDPLAIHPANQALLLQARARRKLLEEARRRERLTTLPPRKRRQPKGW